MFKPLGSNVLVQLAPPKTQTESGILLPETQDMPVVGLVLAVGPAVDEESGVAEGDFVLMPKYSGLLFGKNYVFIDVDELVGIAKADEQTND